MALYIQKDYIKLDCDKCGDEVCFITVKEPQHYDSNVVKKRFKVICRECLL